MSSPLNILQLCDGRAGHDNQSAGLIEALSRLRSVNPSIISLNSSWQGVFKTWRSTTSPSLIIGAGHATHMGLLLGAMRHKARSIVLMTPSFPCAMFDLCIIPEHDQVRAHSNVLLSEGALNRIQVSTERDSNLALILIGGPSKHYQWDGDSIVEQIKELIRSRDSLRWIVASSPRTPATTVRALQAIDGIQLMLYQDSNRDWLPNTLAQASLVWVSEDSVSMAYEALSSGAQTGLLHVPGQRSSRVQKAVQSLKKTGRIVDTAQWLKGQSRQQVSQPLQEAARCAQHILDRWPELR